MAVGSDCARQPTEAEMHPMISAQQRKRALFLPLKFACMFKNPLPDGGAAAQPWISSVMATVLPVHS